MKSKLNINEQELLKMVMNFVNDAHTHNIEELAIEQELSYIVGDIEALAMDIESGKYDVDRSDDDRVRGER
jgi:hypothetical protein